MSSATQFDFIGTWNDSWATIDTILTRSGTTLIPDLWYDTPSPLLFDALDESLKSLLLQRRRLYIWCTEFSRHPPVLEKQGSGPNAGKFFLRLTLGGPGLELTLPACFELQGIVNLNFGNLSYARETFNPESGRWEKPSSQLKAGYANIRTLLCEKVLRQDNRIWMGPEAMHLLREGHAKIVE
jgi:hypothetical protein